MSLLPFFHLHLSSFSIWFSYLWTNFVHGFLYQVNESKAYNLFAGGQAIKLRLCLLVKYAVKCLPFAVNSFHFQNQVLINRRRNAECETQLGNLLTFWPGDASRIHAYQLKFMVSSAQRGSHVTSDIFDWRAMALLL